MAIFMSTPCYVDYASIQRADGPVGILVSGGRETVYTGVDLSYMSKRERFAHSAVYEALDRCGLRFLFDGMERDAPVDFYRSHWYPAPGCRIFALDLLGGVCASPLAGDFEQIYLHAPGCQSLYLAETLQEFLQFLVFDPDCPALLDRRAFVKPSVTDRQLLTKELHLEPGRIRFAARFRPAPEFRFFDSFAQAMEALPFLDTSGLQIGE